MGLFYENKSEGTDYSESYIQYHQHKEYIWQRRKDLNGAKLRVGYVISEPYLDIVNSENNIKTGGELTYGNIVSL